MFIICHLTEDSLVISRLEETHSLDSSRRTHVDNTPLIFLYKTPCHHTFPMYLITPRSNVSLGLPPLLTFQPIPCSWGCELPSPRSLLCIWLIVLGFVILGMTLSMLIPCPLSFSPLNLQCPKHPFPTQHIHGFVAIMPTLVEFGVYFSAYRKLELMVVSASWYYSKCGLCEVLFALVVDLTSWEEGIYDLDSGGYLYPPVFL